MGFHHGLSGLNAASKSLDVSGHNIANSNTIGFKKSRAEFNEMVASAMEKKRLGLCNKTLLLHFLFLHR